MVVIMKIFVLKQEKAIGYLEETLVNEISFIYFDNIEKDEYLPGLTLKINYSDNGLFNIFHNFLPENEQLRLLRKNNHINNNIEILLHLKDIHGSYQFLNEEDYTAYDFKEERSLYLYNDIKDDMLNSNYTYPNILDNYKLDIHKNKIFPQNAVNEKEIGLSGFQYKFGVSLDNDDKIVYIDENKKSSYFMKPYSLYYSQFCKTKDKDRLYIPYLLINEHLFMTLARDIGFTVPYNAIIKDGADYHYIIKRFDRYKNGSFDHEEFATLMGYNSNQKYNSSVIEVLNKASEYVNENKLRELLRFFFFSIIISHGDLHSKNISLINISNNTKEQNKDLAPYYDISTTSIYKGIDNKDIGLKIGNKKSKIKKVDFINIADKFNILDFEKDMKEIVSFFSNNFKTYIQKLPSDIKQLPFYTGRLSSHRSLEAYLLKYYDNRIKYIQKYIDNSWITDKDDIF